MAEMPANDEVIRTIAIAAFGGWNDAGTASSEALSHLMNTIGVDENAPTHTIDANGYVDFQINRPLIARDSEGQRRVTWPHTQIIPLLPHQGTRILLITGPEPSFNWTGYCEEILDRIDIEGCTLLVTLGALLADTPHTRPLPTTVTWSSHTPQVADANDYEGPIGIPTILNDIAVEAGVGTLAVWVQVPNYVGQNPVPKAAWYLLTTLGRELDMQIPLEELDEDVRAWERGMDAMANEEEDIKHYIEQLESLRDATELPEASGERIASEFEQFLRSREDGQEN